MRDTTPAAQRRIQDLMGRRTPTDRVRMACSMFDAGRKLVEAGMLQSDKSLSQGEIRSKVFLRLYGNDFAQDEIGKIMRHLAGVQHTSKRP